MNDNKKTKDNVHGEGNYSATRDYDKRTEKFISEKKSEIPKYAKDAEKEIGRAHV